MDRAEEDEKTEKILESKGEMIKEVDETCSVREKF